MPDTRVDALEAATRCCSALRLRQRLPKHARQTPGIDSPTLNVGLIEGGINTNVVPDRVTFRLDRRIIPEEVRSRSRPAAQADHRQRRTLPRHQGDGAAGAARRRWFRSRAASGSRRDPAPRQAILGKTCPSPACRSSPTPVTTPPGHSDGALWRRPADEAGSERHIANENIRLRELRTATKIVALAVAELLGAG